VTAFLSTEDIFEIHRRVIEITGGAAGIRDVGLLDSAVHRPQATFGGVSLYPTLAKKAGALFHSLAKNHAFVDGNKRVAFEALDVFVRLNGGRLEGTEDEKYDFVMGVASGELEFDAIVEWIEEHMHI
jgi:death-on-curing protein